ncbi:MAG TPA: zinc-ribbon domain-containing protein [Thermomicrobiales bacterium]|jgi:hypothetical protein
MSLNPVTCGNCGTENSPDEEFCTNCGQPLTQSAEEGLRENIEAQDSPSLFGAGGAAPGPGVVGAGGVIAAGGVGRPLVTGGNVPDPDLPPRD